MLTFLHLSLAIFLGIGGAFRSICSDSIHADRPARRPLIHQFVRSPLSASGADKAIGPAARRQVALAGLLGGELALKLPQRFGKTAVGAPLNTTCRGLLSQPDKQKSAIEACLGTLLAYAQSSSDCGRWPAGTRCAFAVCRSASGIAVRRSSRSSRGELMRRVDLPW
jgi:hypothetical protein